MISQKEMWRLIADKTPAACKFKKTQWGYQITYRYDTIKMSRDWDDMITFSLSHDDYDVVQHQFYLVPGDVWRRSNMKGTQQYLSSASSGFYQKFDAFHLRCISDNEFDAEIHLKGKCVSVISFILRCGTKKNWSIKHGRAKIRLGGL